MYENFKEWSQKTFPDLHTMTIVRPTFFGCRLLFVTINFVFGMNNVVTKYQISSSVQKKKTNLNLDLSHKEKGGGFWIF